MRKRPSGIFPGTDRDVQDAGIIGYKPDGGCAISFGRTDDQSVANGPDGRPRLACCELVDRSIDFALVAAVHKAATIDDQLRCRDFWTAVEVGIIPLPGGKLGFCKLVLPPELVPLGHCKIEGDDVAPIGFADEDVARWRAGGASLALEELDHRGMGGVGCGDRSGGGEGEEGERQERRFHALLFAPGPAAVTAAYQMRTRSSGGT